MLARIKALSSAVVKLWRSLPPAVQRVCITWGAAFIGTLALGIVPWFHDLTAWVSSNGQTAFPSWHNLTFILLAAVVGAFTAVAHLFGIALTVGRAARGKHA